MNRSCHLCGVPSGTCLVCEPCRHHLTPREHERLTILWHSLVCAESFDPGTELYRCYHCQRWFTRERVIGDHFPVTKGADATVRFDLAKGVTSCMFCNTSGSAGRTRSLQKLPSGRCVKCRIFLAVRDGLCIKCL